LVLSFAAFFFTLLLTSALQAETGAEAWLRYARLDANASRIYEKLPSTVVVPEDTSLLRSAQQELLRGIDGMLANSLRAEPNLPQDSAIILGTLRAVQKIIPSLHPPVDLQADAFWLTTARVHGVHHLVITAKN